MRLTLGNVLPEVAQALNLNQGGAKALGYLNRAQEELLNKGRWVGTTVKYRVCSYSGHITWPREIQTVEALKVCGAYVPLQNQWYSFLDYGGPWESRFFGTDWARGFGYFGAFVGADQAEAISFVDLCGTGNAKKLKVYGTATEAAGARILLQFYDGSGNYVRTNDMTEGWVDGEFVAINPTTPQTTINAVTSWVGVQKPVTNGAVRITELDTVTNLERLLAVYEPGETNPSYRRTFLPGFGSSACGSPSTCGPRSVEIIASQRFIPAVSPRDYLCISSKAALIYQSKAVYLNDNNNAPAAMTYEANAEAKLNDELNKWTGNGTIQTPNINVQGRCAIGTENFI